MTDLPRFSVGAQTHLGVTAFLTGHDAPVRCLAVTDDGTRLVSGAEDQTARIWDVPARRELVSLAHEGEVYAVAISRHGKHVVSGGGDCVVRIWDGRGKPIATSDGDMHVVTALAIDAAGKRVLAGFDDGTLRLLDLATGKKLKKLAGPTNAVWGVAFSPDGTRAAAGDWDGKLIVWNLETGKQIATREGHSRNFGGLGFTGDGARVAYTVENELHVAEVTGKAEPNHLAEHQSALYAFAVASGGKHALSGGGEGNDVSIGLWDLSAGTLVHRYQVHDGGNRGLAISRDGTLGFSCGYHDRRIAILDLASRPPFAGDTGHPGALLEAAFNPATRTVITAGMEGALRVFGLAGGKQQHTIQLGEYPLANALEVTSDGATAVILGGGSIRSVDLATGSERAPIKTSGYPRVLAIAPDASRVAYGDDKAVRLATFAGGKPTALKGHKESISALAFSSDGSVLASGSDDASIRLWDARAGAAKGKPLTGHDSDITTLAFAGRHRLVSGSRDYTVRIWDLERSKLAATLEGHTQWITALAVSPDGTRAVSCADGDRDGRVRLWDLASNGELARFDPHHGDAFRLAFSADGAHAYSISRDDRSVVTLF